MYYYITRVNTETPYCLLKNSLNITKQVINEQRIKHLSLVQVVQMNHNSLVKDYWKLYVCQRCNTYSSNITKQVANEQRIKRLSVVQVAQMNHNSLVKDYRNTFLMITELCAAEQQI